MTAIRKLRDVTVNGDNGTANQHPTPRAATKCGQGLDIWPIAFAVRKTGRIGTRPCTADEREIKAGLLARGILANKIDGRWFLADAATKSYLDCPQVRDDVARVIAFGASGKP
jgi:hypothetical protein